MIQTQRPELFAGPLTPEQVAGHRRWIAALRSGGATGLR